MTPGEVPHLQPAQPSHPQLTTLLTPVVQNGRQQILEGPSSQLKPAQSLLYYPADALIMSSYNGGAMLITAICQEQHRVYWTAQPLQQSALINTWKIHTTAGHGSSRGEPKHQYHLSTVSRSMSPHQALQSCRYTSWALHLSPEGERLCESTTSPKHLGHRHSFGRVGTHPGVKASASMTSTASPRT